MVSARILGHGMAVPGLAEDDSQDASLEAFGLDDLDLGDLPPDFEIETTP